MEYYLFKDLEGQDLPDSLGVKLVEDGVIYTVPADLKNRHYAAYLAWKAEDPENNAAQSEPE